MKITYLYRGNRTSLLIRDYCNNYDKFIKFGCSNFQCTLGVKIPFTKKAIFITLTRNLKVDKYRFGVYLKEIIENKAHNLGLKGIWIDLNDLSKDEGYYFRHCSEVFEGLIEFMVIKDNND